MRATYALGIVLALSVTPAAADDWSTFNDPAGAFQVQVPQAPTTESKMFTRNDGSQVPQSTYTVDLGTCALLAIEVSFAGHNLDPDTALGQAVNGTKSGDRRVVSEVAITRDGHTGRDIVLTDSSNDVIEDRIFFFNDRLFQFITVQMANAPPEQAEIVKRYAASVHFLQ